jgi:hypothetical protein
MDMESRSSRQPDPRRQGKILEERAEDIRGQVRSGRPRHAGDRRQQPVLKGPYPADLWAVDEPRHVDAKRRDGPAQHHAGVPSAVDAEIQGAAFREASRRARQRTTGRRHIRQHPVARDEIEAAADAPIHSARPEVGHQKPDRVPGPPPLQVVGDRNRGRAEVEGDDVGLGEPKRG